MAVVAAVIAVAFLLLKLNNRSGLIPSDSEINVFSISGFVTETGEGNLTIGDREISSQAMSPFPDETGETIVNIGTVITDAQWFKIDADDTALSGKTIILTGDADIVKKGEINSGSELDFKDIRPGVEVIIYTADIPSENEVLEAFRVEILSLD